LNTQGKAIGKAELTEGVNGVQVKVEAASLTPGEHGLHFHQIGKCDAPDFKSAGDHFNPQGKKHGTANPEGPHAGDLPNLVVGTDGKAAVTVTTKLVTLAAGKPNSLLKTGGTALVIHEKADDYKTDPSGNSGARIACGVIQ
jgi:superoxide dismutase, Cu-Zn family